MDCLLGLYWTGLLCSTVFIFSYYAALLPRRGPHIASHSVCLSVCPSIPLSLPSVTSFRQPLASRMYFSARTEGRISYGHLGRTNSCFFFNFYFGSCGRLSWLSASFRAHVNIVSLLTYLLAYYSKAVFPEGVFIAVRRPSVVPKVEFALAYFVAFNASIY